MLPKTTVVSHSGPAVPLTNGLFDPSVSVHTPTYPVRLTSGPVDPWSSLDETSRV